MHPGEPSEEASGIRTCLPKGTGDMAGRHACMHSTFDNAISFSVLYESIDDPML